MYFNGEMFFNGQWAAMGWVDAMFILGAILVAALIAGVWIARSSPPKPSCKQEDTGRT